jgi:hypothetical protein
VFDSFGIRKPSINLEPVDSNNRVVAIRIVRAAGEKPGLDTLYNYGEGVVCIPSSNDLVKFNHYKLGSTVCTIVSRVVTRKNIVILN